MDEKALKPRIVFMGTPEFAATILKSVLEWEGGDVVGVFTQPDRPCGRGQVCKPPAVKLLAQEHGLTVLQPERLKSDEEIDLVRALEPDLLVVAAYGLILPQAVLDIPSRGAVNVHASLLPKYRGAAPIQRAIMDGEPATGITIMQMEAGLDTGPILLQRAMAIGIDDTAATLHDDLARMGGTLLVETLDKLFKGVLKPMPQDPERATYAPKLTKQDGEIRFDRPARQVHDHIRAVTPWPGAFFYWQALDRDKPVRITLYPGAIGEKLTEEVPPGTILDSSDGRLAFACADRLYLVDKLKPAGKKVMDGKGFACGYLSRCEE